MYESSPESLHLSHFHSFTLPVTRMSHLEWLSGLHYLYHLYRKVKYTLIDFKYIQSLVKYWKFFSEDTTQPWPKWALFLDCREHPINPEAAISNANLNLRGESAKRWLIISPLASGVTAEWPFYGCPKVGGCMSDMVLKGAQRDKCRMVDSCRDIPSPLLLPLYATDFFNHLRSFSPSVGVIKADNFRSATPLLNTKLPSHRNRSTNI